MYPPAPGELGTVGVIDCRVQHIAGQDMSLCERWPRHQLWSANETNSRSRLPICKRCAQKQNEQR